MRNFPGDTASLVSVNVEAIHDGTRVEVSAAQLQELISVAVNAALKLHEREPKKVQELIGKVPLVDINIRAVHGSSQVLLRK